MRAGLVLAALLLLPLASAHEGADEPGLATATGGPAMVGALAGLHAPGPLVVAPYRAGPMAIDGHIGDYASPARVAPGLDVSFARNATHLAVAVEHAGAGWFLVGLDLQEASRALVAMQQSLVARHLAVAGYLQDGNLTWCTGTLGIVYPDPRAALGAGHGAFGAAMAMEQAPVVYDVGGEGCRPAAGVTVAATVSEGTTRVEVGVPLALLGAEPGAVRHVVVAAEPARGFLPPKLTTEATRGDVNVLLARDADAPAALRALVQGAPSLAAGASLLAVPGAVLLVGLALRRKAS